MLQRYLNFFYLITYNFKSNLKKKVKIYCKTFKILFFFTKYKKCQIPDHILSQKLKFSENIKTGKIIIE